MLDVVNKLVDFVEDEFPKRYSSQTEFAKACGVTEGAIRKLRTRQSYPTLFLIHGISSAFDLSISELFTRIE